MIRAIAGSSSTTRIRAIPASSALLLDRLRTFGPALVQGRVLRMDDELEPVDLLAIPQFVSELPGVSAQRLAFAQLILQTLLAPTDRLPLREAVVRIPGGGLVVIDDPFGLSHVLPSAIPQVRIRAMRKGPQIPLPRPLRVACPEEAWLV